MRYLFIIFMFILVSGKSQTTLPAYQERIRILPSQLLAGSATNGQILQLVGGTWTSVNSDGNGIYGGSGNVFANAIATIGNNDSLTFSSADNSGGKAVFNIKATGTNPDLLRLRYNNNFFNCGTDGTGFNFTTNQRFTIDATGYNIQLTADDVAFTSLTTVATTTSIAGFQSGGEIKRLVGSTVGDILRWNGATWGATSLNVGDVTNGGNTTGSTITIGSNDANDLVLETNNTARLTITSGGSTKIGTTNSSPSLLVLGSVNATRAPLTFVPGGTLLTTIAAYTIEQGTDRLYHTNGALVRETIGGVVYSQLTDITIANTASITDLFGTGYGTTILTANYLTAGKTMRIKCHGVFSTPATPGTLTISVIVAGTTIATTTSTALPASVTNRDYEVELTIACKNSGVSGALTAFGYFSYTGASGIVREKLNSGISDVTANTTVDQAIMVRAQWDTASSSKTLTNKITTIEALN